MRRAPVVVGLGLAAFVAGAFGCSALVNLDGYVGGADASEDGTSADAPGDGGFEADGETGGSTGDGGCSCLPGAPPGWALVAFSANGSAPCPTGYADAMTVRVDPSIDAAASCTCDCQVGTHPSCVNGLVTVSGSNTAGACASGTVVQKAVDGKCDLDTGGKQADSYHSVTRLGASGGTCSPSTTANVPDAGGSTGVVCEAAGAASTCGDGGACAAAVDAPFALCIEATDASVCPQGYAHMHSAGTGLVDTRGCNANCVCPSPSATCSNASYAWYADNACATTPIAAVTADGTCRSTLNGGQTVAAYKYAATAGATCGPPDAQATPDGSLSLVAPRTICCP